jgi:hypothetical protein
MDHNISRNNKIAEILRKFKIKKDLYRYLEIRRKFININDKTLFLNVDFYLPTIKNCSLEFLH